MIDQLRLAMSKLEHNTDDRLTDHLQNELMKWGVQVQRWKDEMEAKLERQFDWLDPKNRNHPKYEDRFVDWWNNLEEYKRACRLLQSAKEMM